MATAAKVRAKSVAKIVFAPEQPAPQPAPASSKSVHALLDELFVALKPYGACESPKIVTLFHRLKSAV